MADRPFFTDTTFGGIFGQTLQVAAAGADGFFVNAQQSGDGGDTAVTELLGFNGGVLSSILLVQGVEKSLHRLTNIIRVRCHGSAGGLR